MGMTLSTTEKSADLAPADDLEETPEQMWDSMGQDAEDTSDGDDDDQGPDDDDTSSSGFDDTDWNADGDEKPALAPAKDEKQASTKPDIWANATDEQRRELDKLQERDRRTRGQVSATAKRMNELRERLAALDSDDGDEELKRLNEDYPDVAGPLVRTQTQIRDAVRALSEAEGIRADDANALHSEQLEEQRASVQAAHPEWEKMIGSNVEAFRSWTEDQPKAIRDAVEANMEDVYDADALSSVLSSFKAHLDEVTPVPPVPGNPAQTKTLSAHRKRQLAGAKAIAGQTRQTTAVNTASDDDGQAIWDELQEQEAMQQRRRGR